MFVSRFESGGKRRASAAAAVCAVISFLAPIARADDTRRYPSPPPAAPPPLPAPAPFPPYPYYAPPRALTFSASDPAAELQVRQRDENNRVVWHTVCVAACNTTVYPGAEYRVAGDGVTGSRVIRIESSPYSARLYAEAGSSSARTLGIVVVSVGGAAMILGLVGLVLSAECTNCDAAERADHQRRIWQLAVPLMVGGGAAVAGGIVLVLSNRTKLEYGVSGTAFAPRLRLGRGFEIGPEGLRF